MNLATNPAARRSGVAAAALAGVLMTSAMLHSPPQQLAIVNSVRPAPPIPVPKVAGIHTGALRVYHTKDGALVVDSQGFPLYRYSRDHNRPSSSRCGSQCAVDWPPVLAGAQALRLSGISPAQVGSVLRPDGLRQLTLDGWPLYRYRADASPYVGTGNGINATWYLIGPTGAQAIPPAKVTLPPNDPAMGNLEGGDDT